MKETNELLGFAATTINTGYAVAEDGKVDFNDLSRLLPLIFAGQDGIGGIKEVPAEQAVIGKLEKDNIRGNIESKLINLNPIVADDWKDALMGIYSIYRLGQRIGKEDTIKRIKAGVSIEQIEAE